MAGWERVWRNQGAAGGDGVTASVFSVRAPERIAALSSALRDGGYRPGPLRRVHIPKPKGGVRRLTIPCVADRIAQSAVAQALGAELDAEMEEGSYAYRPGRGVADAVRHVERLRADGFVWTLDADIDDFFDTIPIDALMRRLARSVSEGPLLELVGLWLEQGAEIGRGVAQGSPLSPLLANLYLDDLDEALSGKGLRIVRYADDFVVLARDRPAAEAARGKVERLLAEHGLALDKDKTRIRGYDDSLKFLGHVFVRSWAMKEPDEDEPGAPGFETLLRRVAREDAEREAAQRDAAEEARALEEAGLAEGLRVLHVHRSGRRLALRNQSFSVLEGAEHGAPDRGAELAAIHHTRVDRIEIGPDVEADIDALRHALACNVPVAFVNGHGAASGYLAPVLAPRAGRHLAQARHALDPALRLDLARRLVVGRLANLRSALRRLNHRRGSALAHGAAEQIGRYVRAAPRARSIDMLMGFEGAATKIYWRAWGSLLMHGFDFEGRRRRAGASAVDIALDIAAGLLTRDIGAIALAVGLHPGFGVLHATSDARDACVYDLMEEFRAGLVESLVLTLVNTRTLGFDMFSKQADESWRIGREGHEAIIRGYEARARSAVKSPRSGKRVSWRRLMREQAEAYAAHVEGRAPYSPYVIDN